MRRTGIALLLYLVISASPISAQRGAYTAVTHLDQMTSAAETILRGRVISATSENHPQLSSLKTVIITLRVDRVLKGSATPGTFTFRQYIWDMRDQADSAGYRRGQEMLLFLNRTSQYGLTSPVGMEQGRFRIDRDSTGNAFAVNGRANAGLFADVAPKAAAKGIALSPRVRAMMVQESGRVPLSTLEEAIVGFAQGDR